MYLARFTLTGSAPPTRQLAETVHDAIWAHLPTGHRLEHLTATATPDGIDLVVFLPHGLGDPQGFAQHLLDAIARTSPVLAALTSAATPLRPPHPDALP